MTKKATTQMQNQNTQLIKDKANLEDQLSEVKRENENMKSNHNKKEKHFEEARTAAELSVANANKKLLCMQTEYEQKHLQAHVELEAKLETISNELTCSRNELNTLKEEVEKSKQVQAKRREEMNLQEMSVVALVNALLKGSIHASDLKDANGYLLSLCSEKWKHDGLTYDNKSNQLNYLPVDTQLPSEPYHRTASPMNEHYHPRSYSPMHEQFHRSPSPLPPMRMMPSPYNDSEQAYLAEQAYITEQNVYFHPTPAPPVNRHFVVPKNKSYSHDKPTERHHSYGNFAPSYPPTHSNGHSGYNSEFAQSPFNHIDARPGFNSHDSYQRPPKPYVSK
jgi:hypothetical protein